MSIAECRTSHTLVGWRKAGKPCILPGRRSPQCSGRKPMGGAVAVYLVGGGIRVRLNTENGRVFFDLLLKLEQLLREFRRIGALRGSMFDSNRRIGSKYGHIPTQPHSICSRATNEPPHSPTEFIHLVFVVSEERDTPQIRLTKRKQPGGRLADVIFSQE